MPWASTPLARWESRSWRFSTLKKRERSAAFSSFSDAGFEQQACYRVIQSEDLAVLLLSLLGLLLGQGENVHISADQGGDRVGIVRGVVVNQVGDAGGLHPALSPVGFRAGDGDRAFAGVCLPGVDAGKGERPVGNQIFRGQAVMPLAGLKIGLGCRACNERPL